MRAVIGFACAFSAMAYCSMASAQQCPGGCPEGRVCNRGACELVIRAVGPGDSAEPPPAPAAAVPQAEPVSAADAQPWQTTPEPLQPVNGVQAPPPGYGPAQAPPTYGAPPAPNTAYPVAEPMVVDAEAAPVWQESNFDIAVNVLGFLQFGPVIKPELGGFIAGHARIRIMNAGLLNYIYDLDLVDEEFSWGLGIGGGMRSYITGDGSMKGFYAGAGAEYIHYVWDQYSDDFDFSSREMTSAWIAPYGEVGYRFAMGSRFLLSLGAVLGNAFLLDSDDPSEEDEVFGMANLEIGFFF